MLWCLGGLENSFPFASRYAENIQLVRKTKWHTETRARTRERWPPYVNVSDVQYEVKKERPYVETMSVCPYVHLRKKVSASKPCVREFREITNEFITESYGKCASSLKIGWKVKKGKAVPLQAWSGPEGSRKLRFPDFMTTAQDGGMVVSRLYSCLIWLYSCLIL